MIFLLYQKMTASRKPKPTLPPQKALCCSTLQTTETIPHGYVTHSNAGEGLLFYGDTIVPFVDNFPKDTELYQLMTTKPNEVKEDAEE